MTHEAPSPESLLEHREWLRAIARSLVRDENVVDDVEQRTWLTVLRNRRPVTSARGWLRRVVRSAAVDEHRSESRRHVREEGVARSVLALLAGDPPAPGTRVDVAPGPLSSGP